MGMSLMDFFIAKNSLVVAEINPNSSDVHGFRHQYFDNSYMRKDFYRRF